MTDADIVRDTLSWIHTHHDLSMEFQREAEAALDRLEAERDKWKEHGEAIDRTVKRLRAAEAERDRLRAALERIETIQPKVLGYIRDNGFVFDGIGTEPGNWQHLAFSIYSDLCEADAIAREVLER